MEIPIHTYTATELQSMVRNMDDTKEKYAHLKSGDLKEYEEAVGSENKILYDDFYTIFRKHLSDELDSTFFYMLDQKRRVESGEITDDQAAVEVGKKLAERWIDPVISNVQAPPSISYGEYYKSL